MAHILLEGKVKFNSNQVKSVVFNIDYYMYNSMS